MSMPPPTDPITNGKNWLFPDPDSQAFECLLSCIPCLEAAVPVSLQE